MSPPSPSFDTTVINRSELIAALVREQTHLKLDDVELAIKTLLDKVTQSLASGERIEIRGFGSFSLHRRPPRLGRNPKTGVQVALPERFMPHFKPGKDLRQQVCEVMPLEAPTT